jgi:hypothetical protein
MKIGRIEVDPPRKIHVDCPRGHRIGTAQVRDSGGSRLSIDMQVKALRSKWFDEYREDSRAGKIIMAPSLQTDLFTADPPLHRPHPAP